MKSMTLLRLELLAEAARLRLEIAIRERFQPGVPVRFVKRISDGGLKRYCGETLDTSGTRIRVKSETGKTIWISFADLCCDERVQHESSSREHRRKLLEASARRGVEEAMKKLLSI